MAHVDRRCFCAVALATAICARSSLALARSCSHVSYDDARAVGGKPLRLNGVGVRQATIFHVDVYVAALYVERPSRNAADLLKLDQLEDLVLTLVRDVSAEQMNEAISDGFKKNAGSAYDGLRARIGQLQGAIPSLKAENVFELTFTPGQGVSLVINGKARTVVAGSDFATVLLAIWLGSSPPNDGLKRGLLGGSC